jgi:hypothetical protein
LAQRVSYPLTSELRIRIEGHGDVWIAYVDVAEAIDCGIARRFDAAVAPRTTGVSEEQFSGQMPQVRGSVHKSMRLEIDSVKMRKSHR